MSPQQSGRATSAPAPSPFLRRTRAAALALALGAALTACAEPVLGVEGATVAPQAEGSSPSAGASSASASPALPAGLEAVALVLGPFSMHLPTGWAALGSAAGVASGATSTAGGAGTYTVVPAAGKDQTAWVNEILTGTSGVVEERDGLVQQPDVLAADGRSLFHVVHTYSDNRAHLFGLVADDQLHMIRFGLDGSETTSAVIAQAVATATYTGALPAPVSMTVSSVPTPTPAA